MLCYNVALERMCLDFFEVAVSTVELSPAIFVVQFLYVFVKLLLVRCYIVALVTSATYHSFVVGFYVSYKTSL